MNVEQRAFPGLAFPDLVMHLKLLVPLVIIAAISLATMGPAYLGATEATAATAVTETTPSTLLKTLAASDQAVKAGDLAALEPSRLLLLIIGIILVGIAYQRSWTGFRNARQAG